MRAYLRDNFWIVVLSAAALFFLNIIIQARFPAYSMQGRYYQAQKSDLPDTLADSAQIDKSFSPPIDTKPPLQLNLRLLGTITGNPSLAIIFDLDSGKHNLYKLNDTIKGATIANILENKVILEKDSSSQELLFEIGSKNIAKIDKKGAVIVSPQEIIISKSGMMKEMGNANELLTKIKVMPVPDEALSNKLKGFRIDNVPADSIIERAGVKSGDVICFIQGQRLESSLEALRIFQAVQSQSEIKVDVLRNDKLITLRYKVKD